MTLVLASFFGSFLFYLLLGLLALVVTAALDRSLGKERALLLWAFVVLGLTFLLLLPSHSSAAIPKPKTLALEERHDPSKLVAPRFDPLTRAPIPESPRNLFQQQSDTSPLPPVVIAEPPPVPLAFPLAPTIPGLGPAARRAYRGAVPEVKAGDGSKLPEVPADTFSAYVPKPEDVFDWIVKGGSRVYVYVREIDGVKEGTEEFEGPTHPASPDKFPGLKWNLALQGDPAQGWPRDWKAMRVTYAIVGNEERAKTYLDNVRKARQQNISTNAGEEHEGWFLRRSVENQFVDACRAQGNARPQRLSVDGLKAVASQMATLGASGKEDGLGWKKAVLALQLALAKSKEPPARNPQEILLALIEAYRALHDEPAAMATLKQYIDSNPSGSGLADGSTWLGDLFLERLRLPDAASAFFWHALALAPASRQALIGRGDALTLEGDHAGALKAYRQAAEGRTTPDTAVRQAEALLRNGLLLEAKQAADQALAAASYDARALVAKGAVLYAAGDVQGARDAFAQAAALPGEGSEGSTARRHRGEALYDLGLAEWRLGHGDAAAAAFDAADVALRTGSQGQRSPDETVAPEIGRALLQISAGNLGEAAEALERARTQGPGVAYLEMLAGWIAATQGDPSRARPRFENALLLAPDLAELDGWLSDVRLRLAEGAVAAGVPVGEASPDFEAAVRFAERAAERELKAAPGESDFAAREGLVRLRNLVLSERKRFETALKTAEDTLARVREERRALALKGYCNYRLGVFDAARYGECLRDFQAVVDLTAGKADDALRVYAKDCLEAVKKWQSLEQMTIRFTDTKLSQDWGTYESQGVKVVLEQGQMRFRDATRDEGAKSDGSRDDPTVFVKNEKQLFDRERFEEIEVTVRIPTKDASGAAVNNVTFGVVLQAPGSKGVSKGNGLGVFYDKARLSLRVGGGVDATYKDGEIKRVLRDGAEREFDPDDKTGAGRPVKIVIRRTNDREGTWTVTVGDTLILEDKISSFKRAKGPLELWIGGWSTKAMKWNAAVEEIRIIRRKP